MGSTRKSKREKNLAYKVLRNSLYNSAGWGITVAVNMAATPYIVHKLGIEGYGVYALLTGLVGYYALMDLGLTHGIIRFVAHYRAIGRGTDISRLVNSSLFFYVLLGGVVSGVLLIFAEDILRVLNTPDVYRNDAIVGLSVCAIGFFFTFLSGVFSGLLMGVQRYDLTSKVSAGSNLVLMVIIVLALAQGGGLLGITVITAWFSIATFLLYWFVAVRVVPEWKPSLRFHFGIFRELFDFSGYLFVSRLSDLFHQYFVRYLLGALLGPSAVTHYTVALKLIGAFGGFFTQAFSVLFPFASELRAKDRNDSLRQVYVAASKVFCSLSFPFMITLAIFARPVLELWINAEIAQQASVILSLLSVSSLLGSLTTVSNHIVMGMGKSRIIAVFSFATLAVLVVVTPVLTKQFGITGTGLAMIIASIPGLTLVMYQTKKILEIELMEYFRNVLTFHVVAVCVYLICALVAGATLPQHSFTMAIVGVVLLSVYFILMHLLDWFSIRQILDLYRPARPGESLWPA